MITQHLAMIRHEDDQRIFALAGPVQRRQHLADLCIDQIDHSPVGGANQTMIVIGHFWLHTLLTAASLSDTPRVSVHLCPIGVRSKHVSPIGPDLGTLINGLLWNLGDYVTSRQLFRSANALRVREGLPPVRSLQRELFVSSELTLIAASPTLCPRQPDWDRNIQISGFLTLEPLGRADALPDGLRRFLDAGEPPVYFTFGSCEIFYGEENAELFLETIARTGERAIIQTSYTDAVGSYDRSRIHVVDEADHRQVFPRCKLVVHHGGAGTTQTTLRAGVPAIVVEHGFDQTYWGHALVRAGVSPALLHRRSVTPGKLAGAIMRAAQSPDMTRNAVSCGKSIAAEDGVATAVEIIAGRFAPVA